MTRNTNSARVGGALAIGVATTVIVAALVAGAAAGASSDHSAATIKSGAGPGWPKTLRPSDFVRHVSNPWFPLKPAAGGITGASSRACG